MRRCYAEFGASQVQVFPYEGCFLNRLVSLHFGWSGTVSFKEGVSKGFASVSEFKPRRFHFSPSSVNSKFSVLCHCNLFGQVRSRYKSVLDSKDLRYGVMQSFHSFT